MDYDYDYDNTLGPGFFIYFSILGLYSSVNIYKSYLLKNIDGISEQASMRIFWVTVIVGFVVLFLLELRRRRNYFSLVSNMICAFGLYTILSYRNLFPQVIAAVIGLAAVISAAYAIYVLGRRIRNRAKRRKIIKNRIDIAISAAQKCFTVGFTLLFLILAADIYGTADTAEVAAAADAGATYETILAENMDTLGVLLDEDAWSELTAVRRLEILQVVADLEQYRLGIPYALKVQEGIMEDSGGYYVNEYHQIVLKADLVAERSAYALVTMVCHEAYHAYEYCLIDLYENADESLMNLALLQKAGIYKEEFENYVSISDDYETYYDQVCESDARDYAGQEAEAFFEILSGYDGWTALSESG